MCGAKPLVALVDGALLEGARVRRRVAKVVEIRQTFGQIVRLRTTTHASGDLFLGPAVGFAVARALVGRRIGAFLAVLAEGFAVAPARNTEEKQGKELA